MTSPPEPTSDRRKSHLALSSRLRHALANQELTLHYHPIHAINSGAVVSAEALLRWKRKATENAPIEKMADAAERSDATYDLGEWVARTAHHDAERCWSVAPDFRINLNVSARYVGERELHAFVADLVERGLMNASRTNLEITEKSFVRKPAEVEPMLNEVKKLGAELWLDDFGTGHSSVEHLRYFPVDGLKIPSNYVRDMLENSRSRAIVAGIIALAGRLKIRVVAEGVETEEQLKALESDGCDEVQGYVFSKPMPGDALVNLLASR